MQGKVERERVLDEGAARFANQNSNAMNGGFVEAEDSPPARNVTV